MESSKNKKILAQTKGIYNAIAPGFSGTRGRQWQGFGDFGKYVKAGGKVLDLGCGNGRMAETFRDSQVKYLGIDNSEELIKIAKKRFKDRQWAKFKVGDALDLDEPPASFDLALLIAVLHHLPTEKLRLRVLRNISRSLKPGGRLVVSNWNLWQVFGAKKKFRYYRYLLDYREKTKRGFWRLSDAFVPWKPLMDDNLRYVHSFRRGELKRLLRRAGFKIEKISFEKKDGAPATIFTADNLLAIAIKK